MTITIDNIINKLINTYKINELIVVIKRIELIYNINLSYYIADLENLSYNKDFINDNFDGKDKKIQLYYLEKRRKIIIDEIIKLIETKI